MYPEPDLIRLFPCRPIVKIQLFSQIKRTIRTSELTLLRIQIWRILKRLVYWRIVCLIFRWLWHGVRRMALRIRLARVGELFRVDNTIIGWLRVVLYRGCHNVFKGMMHRGPYPSTWTIKLPLLEVTICHHCLGAPELPTMRSLQARHYTTRFTLP